MTIGLSHGQISDLAEEYRLGVGRSLRCLGPLLNPNNEHATIIAHIASGIRHLALTNELLLGTERAEGLYQKVAKAVQGGLAPGKEAEELWRLRAILGRHMAMPTASLLDT